MTEIQQYALPNGVILLAEPVAGAQSLSMSLLTPAGVSREPEGQEGVASVVAEMICRGAGKLDARAHCDALDQLGVQRSTHAETTHLGLNATMIAARVDEALPLLVDMIRRPMMEKSALEPSVDLALQALESLEDEPQQKVFVELRRRHFPSPFGRTSLGRQEDIEKLTITKVRQFHRANTVAAGSIIAFAGKFDWPRLREQVEALLGDWSGKSKEVIPKGKGAGGYHHEVAETTQVHIGLAYDAVPEPDAGSVAQRAAAAVLSGGMSGRLFTEVREKRGLCYAVYASYGSNRHLGAMLSYAGTTVPRAQETFDVLTGELRRIAKGVKKDEFERAIVGMKSSLVMQGESTGARAHAIAADQYIHGRPRTLDERIADIDKLSLRKLNAFVKGNPAGAMTVVTVGPSALKVG